MTRAHCLAAGLLLALGCASSARLTGNFAEYRAYRGAKLGTTLEARLGASEHYLRVYPHGDYCDEVRAWFIPAERRYFRLSWNNLPRLRAYLDAMPRGPHAGSASERIRELEERTSFAARREERAASRARAFEASLAEAADQRRAFLGEISRLTRLFASTQSFGKPLSGLDAELARAFDLRLLPAECERDRCSRVRHFEYGIPDHGQLEQRVLDVTLELKLARGLVQQLSFSGPELLSRVAEAVLVRAIPEDSPQARAEALGSALELIGAASDTALPSERCADDAVSPVVLARKCDSLRLEVIAGTEPRAADRLLVSTEKR